MTSRATVAVLAGALLLVSGIGPAFAQDTSQRCGGLLCDMGMFSGHRDPAFGPETSCGFFCRLTGGGPAADAAAAQQQAAAAQAQQDAAAAAAEPPKPHHRRKHVAKAATAPDAAKPN